MCIDISGLLEVFPSSDIIMVGREERRLLILRRETGTLAFNQVSNEAIVAAVPFQGGSAGAVKELRLPYVRPIVRGKEVKNVEFGAKVNNILVDGIWFIEKLSFNAFSEGTRLVHCLKMHKRLFGVEAKKIGGDTGYAGTENRDYCKANGVQTSFVKRGRPFSEDKKEKDKVRQELARVRATAMEGSFGTQKEHYDLKRVKARTKLTEILYIFFGIHTANVVQLAAA